MHRKLQVFVSSTFKDLQSERQAAVQAILQNGHIPAGMELFAAGDKEQLKVIKRWIKDSDVFMLLLGKRYGSIEPKSRKSYTQVEYEYALAAKKPLFALILNDDAARAKVAQGIPQADVYEQAYPDKLHRFEDLVRSRLCADVGNAGEIKSEVGNSLKELETRPTLSGWVRPKDLKFVYENNDEV
jgi:hypothetical protein